MTQISLFDGEERLRIDKPIRLIELFAGYGSQSLALKYLGVPFEHHKICEWAIPSIQAYKDIHATDDNTDYSQDLSTEEVFEHLFNAGVSMDYNKPLTYEQVKRLGESKARTIYNNIKATNNLVSVCNAKGKDFEITDKDKYTYILTYSFPCQDLSKAGKGKGMAKDSGTRSGLLWEVERILDELNADGGNLPHILLMENVPDVIGTNNIKHFADWVKKLEQLGYTSKWQCMNAKNYGVPQNRDRCFMVSWIGDFYYDFPQEKKLTKRLKDVLETEVDEKYYLSSRTLNYFIEHSKNEETNVIIYDDYNQQVKADQSCINTLTTNCGNDAERNGVKIIEPNLKQQMCDQLLAEGKVKEFDVIRHSYSNARMQDGRTQNKDTTLSPTLDTRCDRLGVCVKDEPSVKQNYRIRKLTPKECGRLMGVKDEDIDRMSVNQSNSKIYHLYGDSIVVDVLMEILGQMT